jgi:primosomal protein N' (replication factor Y)
MTLLIQVAVPVPFLGTLTYRVPPELERPAKGARVLVPLGTRRVTGCVVSASEVADGELAQGDVRDVLDLFDAAPYLPAPVVDLALWIAEYYAASPGEALSSAMPPRAWVESRRLVAATAEGLRQLAEGTSSTLAPLHLRALRLLGSTLPVPVSTLGARLAKTGDAATPSGRPVAIETLIRSLERTGLVKVTQALTGDADGAKAASLVALTAQGLDLASRMDEVDPAGRTAFDAAGLRGARQRALLDRLRAEPGGLLLGDLRRLGIASDVVHRLARRGLVVARRERVERDPFAGAWGIASAAAQDAPVPDLTPEQGSVLQPLAEMALATGFHVALLHGVTGSGKTEVYLRLAEQVLGRGKRVLVLVPEIALTPAVANAFRARFGQRVAVQHSGLSDGERHDQWQSIRRGDVDIVVGTRSAVLAPLGDIGLIVVDEEHDASYKQDESPRYHGRDVAIMRGKHEGALVLLGSATPSLESYRHALAGRYALLRLDRRVLDRPLASVTIVNMRHEFAARGPRLILSRVLQEAVGDRLARREQTLLLLNRRGYSTSVFCRECGGTTECPNCSVSLVIHRRGTASCHYCGFDRRVPTTCPTCGGPYLEHVGFGTERVEAEVSAAFPSARVARLDRDSARKRGAVTTLLGRFGRGEIDVLVGTQMIAKGHDFPRVTLVGVISADVGLGLADFRAGERTFQLLTQVAGRAGRGEVAGEAIVQTLYPEHYSIIHAANQDYRAFAEAEMTFRRAMRYPPEVAMVNLVVRGPSHASAMDAARDLAARISNTPQRRGGFSVLGPAPAPLTRLRGEHRAQLFVKAPSSRRVAMREAVQAAVAARPDLRRRISVDIDPLTVL